MVRARDQVGAHVVRQPDLVPRTVGHDERGARLPELGTAVDLHHLRARGRPAVASSMPVSMLTVVIIAVPGSLATSEKAVGPATDRVGDGGVRERELVARLQMVLVLLGPPAGLRELEVGEGLPAAGNVRDHRIEDGAAVLVLVESLPEVIAQETAGLRGAKGVGARDRAGAVVILVLLIAVAAPRSGERVRRPNVVRRAVAKEGDEVSDSGEAEAHHLGARREVDELVDGAIVEAGRPCEVDGAGVDVVPTARRHAG